MSVEDAAPMHPPAQPWRKAESNLPPCEADAQAVGGNRRVAAERLGIGLRTLYDKLRRYQLK
jgi:DNA-binding NtrC family response regulator